LYRNSYKYSSIVFHLIAKVSQYILAVLIHGYISMSNLEVTVLYM
jgi:hypothetical protein